MTTSFFVFADHLELGLQVRLLRVRLGMRQVDLANAARVSQPDVSALECGKAIPSATRRRIMGAVGLEEVLHVDDL